MDSIPDHRGGTYIVYPILERKTGGEVRLKFAAGIEQRRLLIRG